MFHVDWLRLAADNALPSQPQLNDQPAPIHMNSEEEWYMDKIIAKELHCHGHDITKWLQVKYTGYAVPEWNQASNMKDTATLEQWTEYTKEFQDSHSKLPDGFQHKSCLRQNLWCHH